MFNFEIVCYLKMGNVDTFVIVEAFHSQTRCL